MSNSKDVMSTIPVERRALPDLSLHLDELPVERVLGVQELESLREQTWNPVFCLLSVHSMTLLVLLCLWPSLESKTTLGTTIGRALLEAMEILYHSVISV